MIILNTNNFYNKYNLKLDIYNDYRHFFYLQNHDPIYVFKNQLLNKYSKYSFQNNTFWLVYPNQQTLADINYISNIQYAGSFRNTYEATFLYNDFNYITNLSPYFLAVYNLWQLILPIGKTSTNFTLKDKLNNWKNVAKLWKKWIYFNCNKQKIRNILSLSNKEYLKIAYSKTWNFYKQNSNPCPDIQLPEWLWFNYFYYLKDIKNTIKYYKIAGFQKNALAGIIWMVAVANWLLWEHEKSIYMLLEKINWLNNRLNEKWLSNKKIMTLKSVIDNSIKRALDELNFYIISQTDKRHPECNKQYSCLETKWYIKDEINSLLNYCKSNTNFLNIKTIGEIFSKNIKVSLSNSKCFLLSISLSDWKIKNWNLYSSLLSWWTYYYDTDRQDWWVHILRK